MERDHFFNVVGDGDKYPVLLALMLIDYIPSLFEIYGNQYSYSFSKEPLLWNNNSLHAFEQHVR